MAGQRIRAMGIPWYRREDYPRILVIMADAHLLPTAFEDWQRKAGEVESQGKRSGVITVRAIVDPDVFPAWCAARGLNVDAKARMEFANEEAYRAVKDTH